MFKKILSVVATLLLAAGISVAVAAPASAHTPVHTVTCDTLTFKGTQYETRTGNPTPNRATIVIDGTTVLDQSFGASLPLKTFTFDKTTSHTWSIVVDAVGGTNDTQYDWKASGVTTPCSYPTKAMDVTCTAVSVDWGQALTTALHVNMRIMTKDGEQTLTAYVDQNVDGGYKTLGLRINGFDPIPLTEQQVKSGHLDFAYPVYLEKNGYTEWAVVWVQVDDMHFNQDEKSPWIECNWSTTQDDAYAEVTITPATCDAGEALVLGGTKYATWGKVDGEYTVIATADAGHLFPAGDGVSKDGTTKTFTGKLAGPLDRNSPSCGTAVTPAAPTLVTVTSCGTSGSVTPVAVTGVTYVTSFDPATGVYTVTATPRSGYYFDGDADQVITFTGTVGAFYACQLKPEATIASGECVYSPDGTAQPRTVVITYDNRASNTAVLFRVTSLSSYDRTVAAGAVETITITGIGAAGVDYQVTAGSRSFDLSVAECDEPLKPAVQTRQVVTETVTCSPSDVEVATTTYTTDFVFNTSTVAWEAQPEVAGAPVITHRAMTADEFASECGTSQPSATISYGACVYTADGTAEPREAVITYDNRASTVAVAFRVTSLPAYDRVVAAGAIETVVIPGLGASGVSYSVTAGDESFTLSVPPCAEPERPATQTRQTVSEQVTCSSSEVQVTTTTYTIDYVFDPSTVAWVALAEVASDPVVTSRAITDEEKASDCGSTVETDPLASACGVDSPADAPDGAWIFVAIDPRVVYTITNRVTGAEWIASSAYTSVPAGRYLVTARAAEGYVLSPTAERTWEYFPEDTTLCELPTLPDPDPTGPTDPTDPTDPGTDPTDPGTDPTGPGTGGSGGPAPFNDITLPTLSLPGDLPTSAVTASGLAHTGLTDTLLFAGVGILLMLAGLGIVVIGRRRTATH